MFLGVSDLSYVVQLYASYVIKNDYSSSTITYKMTTQGGTFSLNAWGEDHTGSTAQLYVKITTKNTFLQAKGGTILVPIHIKVTNT